MEEVQTDTLAAADDADVSKQRRKLWDGNFTIFWLLSTLYVLVFIFYMGFRAFGYASVAFIIHTLVALSFIVGCAWNLFHTPSHGDAYRRAHVVSGWIAMASGFFVVLTGYIIVLSGGSSLSPVAQTTFMVTGAFQLFMQLLVILFGRFRKQVVSHLISANVLFYGCALLPAVNRMPQIFGFEDSDLWIFASMTIGFVFCFFSIGITRRRMHSTNG